VHNLSERDCENNLIKRILRVRDGRLPEEEPSLLSPTERLVVMEARGGASGAEPLEGLIVKIMERLQAEPSDSMYRFWLSSCVESFLRGSRAEDQIAVMEYGLLEYLVEEVLSEVSACCGVGGVRYGRVGAVGDWLWVCCRASKAPRLSKLASTFSVR
jgi:hypothetical protein